MLRSIFLWEIKYHLKYPLLYALFLTFALFTFSAISSDNVTLGESVGNEYRNAPINIIRWLTIMSIMGILVVTAFVASSILRDFSRGTHELVFSRPVSRFSYLMGRFTGSMTLSVVVLIGSALGIIIGSYMPWLDPERIGAFRASPYLWTFAVIVLPNLFITGTLFFTIAGRTRSMLTTFMGAVILMVCYLISMFLTEDIENQTLASLMDPFCVAALDFTTRYWTIVEKNTALPPLGGAILLNRLVWTGAGVVVFLWGFLSFRFSEAAAGRRILEKRSMVEEVEAVSVPHRGRELSALFTVARSFSLKTSITQFYTQARLETIGVFRSIPFLVMLAFGVFNVVGGTLVAGQIYGTSNLPVTQSMLQSIYNSYLFLLVIIITIYSGDLVWKERSLKLNELYDALPTPNWVLIGAKLATLILIVLAYTVAGMLTTIGYQLYLGFTNIEMGLYAKGLLLALVPYILICILALAVQVILNNKFLGYLVMVLFLVGQEIASTLGLEHYLWQYAGSPRLRYSDMNGYGHFLAPYFWYNLYWAFFALFLAGWCVLLWVRGTESSWKNRLKQAGLRLRAPIKSTLAIGVIGFLVAGLFIYYNTNILNEFISKDEVDTRLANYEKEYRQYKNVFMPRIIDVRTEVDIFPEDRRVEIRGAYQLVNKEAVPIDSLHLTIPPKVTINSLELRDQRKVQVDEIEFRDYTVLLSDSLLGYYIYDLEEPLAPGDSVELRFDLTLDNRGFVNHNPNNKVVRNGTFFHNLEYFPALGYNDMDQLQDRSKRRKHGLPPVQRMNKIDDEFARRYTTFTRGADRITFETTISTIADQIAIAPGYLQEEWVEGDRRYFHYKMDEPFLNFYSYLSADYTVWRDRWNDVEIEIYYHETHHYNVDLMIDAVKKSLDYFTANFGPYQHSIVRIIEFPGYAMYAQSFATTIPTSETAGFIAKINEYDIDMVTYITAHEVAHQWWAHQVIGADVQGATLLSESLAQYSALMVMEKEYGKEKMRRFLKYELDRYLRGRGRELVEEMPLYLVENQMYIHYQKGSLVMYALRDYLGEEVLNGAIRRFRDDKAFQDPPYTTSLEFLDYIREVTPDSLDYLIEDMFETITLFMNRVEAATFTERDDGRYMVELTVEAQKFRADGQGVETEIAIDDYIDIGVFGEEEIDGKTEETVLYMKKHRIRDNRTTFELVVDEQPVRAGIDPYNKLVDRNSEDNVRSVHGSS
jgi:ABC-type transport system involved in multi-copper enzyme maturation permease subunit